MSITQIDFSNKVAIITGASQGIGEAIATALVRMGVILILGGRRPILLKEKYESWIEKNKAFVFPLDLSDPSSVKDFIDKVTNNQPEIDILVHSAGIYYSGSIGETHPLEVGKLLQNNVIGTYSLYHHLLPFFRPSFSQLICINSSTAFHSKSDVSAFSASSHAIKAITDSFRHEHNGSKIRVGSLFLGRTATPRMEELYQKKGQEYLPDLLL